MKTLTVIELQAAVGDVAEPVRLLQYRLKDRREVPGRAVDYPQHLGSGSLLLQRLARLGQEPRVLHCDHCLRREALKERNLLVGERAHLAARGGYITEQDAVLAQRYGQKCAGAAELDRRPGPTGTLDRVLGSPGRQISDMEEPFTAGQLLQRIARDNREPATQNVDERFPMAASGSSAKILTIEGHQRAVSGVAEAVCLLQDCVEHRGEIAGRGIDDLQYLGGGGLLFQCLARLGQESRVFHRNDRLRRKIL